MKFICITGTYPCDSSMQEFWNKLLVKSEPALYNMVTTNRMWIFIFKFKSTNIKYNNAIKAMVSGFPANAALVKSWGKFYFIGT